MIVYPKSGYDSFISEDEADEYFETRLNARAWDTTNKEAALVTALRSLQELDIVLDLNDPAQLKAIKGAQAEQTLYELNHDLDGVKINELSIGGMLSVKLPQDDTKPNRYSQRALAILHPYVRSRSVSRIR